MRSLLTSDFCEKGVVVTLEFQKKSRFSKGESGVIVVCSLAGWMHRHARLPWQLLDNGDTSSDRINSTQVELRSDHYMHGFSMFLVVS